MSLRLPEIILDEFVRRADPIPWHRPKVRGVTLEKMHRLVHDLVERGLLHRVGVARRVWGDGHRHNDVLLGPTPEGLAYWEARVKGERRGAGVEAVPRHSVGLRAAAVAPRDVFDLPRAPWKHKLTRDLED